MNAPLDAEQRASLEAALKSVTLDDKYTLERGRAYMSGIQALVRLPMLQQERDKAAGLNTAGFISGYRGSPSVVSTSRSGRRRSISPGIRSYFNRA